VFITAEELAVIVPIPEAVLDDADYDIWAEVRPRIVEAFGLAIDRAALHGTNKPSTWPDAIVGAAIAAGNSVSLGANGSLYQDINGENGVIAKLEEKGLSVNGFVGALQLRAKLRGAVDANGQPIFRSAYSSGADGAIAYDLNGTPIQFADNGALDADEALLLAGNFKLARYAIRQDITYKTLDQATIQDGSGNIILNLAQRDAVALRATMRLGWALPKPVHPIAGTTYYPFAVLEPNSNVSIESALYSVTKPVKAATPQATHDAGTGYTAEIAWSPADATFGAAKKYAATVTLTAADGYSFPSDFTAADVVGLPTSTDAESVSVSRVSASTVVITAQYKATAA
jgi:hypothetical protein